MSRREDYKRFIVFCLASLVIIAQAAAFAYVWYDYYRGLIEEPFWRKGNWALIAIYALINTLFSKLYGGLKVGAFAYVWYDYYRGLIEEPFWRKGNWALIAIYALINTLFSKLYGGLKVGYLKKIDVFYSLTLATICTNVVAYFQITLINRWFLNVGPMIEMTFVQILMIILWIFGSRFIYSRLYRARKLLVIYGDRD